MPYIYHSAVPTVQVSLFPYLPEVNRESDLGFPPMPCGPVCSLTCTLDLQGLSLSETLGVGCREIAGFSGFSPPGGNWHLRKIRAVQAAAEGEAEPAGWTVCSYNSLLTFANPTRTDNYVKHYEVKTHEASPTRNPRKPGACNFTVVILAEGK